MGLRVLRINRNDYGIISEFPRKKTKAFSNPKYVTRKTAASGARSERWATSPWLLADITHHAEAFPALRNKVRYHFIRLVIFRRLGEVLYK